MKQDAAALDRQNFLDSFNIIEFIANLQNQQGDDARHVRERSEDRTYQAERDKIEDQYRKDALALQERLATMNKNEGKTRYVEGPILKDGRPTVIDLENPSAGASPINLTGDGEFMSPVKEEDELRDPAIITRNIRSIENDIYQEAADSAGAMSRDQYGNLVINITSAEQKAEIDKAAEKIRNDKNHPLSISRAYWMKKQNKVMGGPNPDKTTKQPTPQEIEEANALASALGSMDRTGAAQTKQGAQAPSRILSDIDYKQLEKLGFNKDQFKKAVSESGKSEAAVYDILIKKAMEAGKK